MTQQAKRECAICGKPILRGGIFLEYDGRHNTWHKPGTVATADSQGGFLVGSACARAAIAKAERK